MLWDLESKKARRLFGGPQDVVFALAFTPDGKQVLASHRDYHEGPSTLRLWDVPTGKEIQSFKGHMFYAESVALSPNGRQALSGEGRRFGGGKTIFLWDLAKQQPVDVQVSPTGATVAFSPDGLQAATNRAKDVQLWDVKGDKLKEAKLFTGHTANVVALAFCPKGGRLAAIDLKAQQGTHLILWDLGHRQPTLGVPFLHPSVSLGVRAGRSTVARSAMRMARSTSSACPQPCRNRRRGSSNHSVSVTNGDGKWGTLPPPLMTACGLPLVGSSPTQQK